MAKYTFARSAPFTPVAGDRKFSPSISTPKNAPQSPPTNKRTAFQASSFNWTPPPASQRDSSLNGFAPSKRTGGTIEQKRGKLVELKVFGQWGIGKLEISNGQKVTVKGDELTTLEIGRNYMLEGQMVEDPKYGLQMQVWRSEPDVESVESVVRHIVRNFNGAGISIAERLVQLHQEQGTLEEFKEALIHAPTTIDFSRVTQRRVKLKDDFDSVKRRLADSLSIRFGTKGLSQSLVTALAEYLLRLARDENTGANRSKDQDVVSFATDLFYQNPYTPLGDVARYGFQTADAVARSIGIDSNDPRRLIAVAVYALTRCCEDCGHMWVTDQSLYTEIGRLSREIDAKQAFALARENAKNIVVDVVDGMSRIYPRALKRAEDTLTKHLAIRLVLGAKPLCSLEGQALQDLISRATSRLAKKRGLAAFELDASQRAALEGILTQKSSVHTLTSGPGCGKTAIVEVLMEALSERRKPIYTTFCAPVGKAAKVLSERVGEWGQAKTIHATLEYGPDGFALDEENQINTDFIVIDECSMLSSPLAAALFNAIPFRAHILMLGDPGQLAPIEPGKVLKSVLDIEGFNHQRLIHTHRNTGAILSLVKSVGEGLCPSQSTQDVQFTNHLPVPSSEVFKRLAGKVIAASERFGGLDKVGVICPMRKGSSTEPGWNVTHLNSVLRDEINPDPTGEKKISGTAFRVNDRIILLKNTSLEIKSETEYVDPLEVTDWEEDVEENGNQCYVVNGDTGWIESVAYEYRDSVKQVKHLVLRLDDDRRVALPHSKLELMSLSYAITVHAAQGSEYQKVFAIATDGLEQFMHRAMLFTMFSRAKQELTVFGDEQVLTKIAARIPTSRNCSLAARVLTLSDRIKEKQSDEQGNRQAPSRARHSP